MAIQRLLRLTVLLGLLLVPAVASAQYGTFGQRNLGGTLGGRGSSSRGSGGQMGSTMQGQEGVGQVTGSERFVRGARQPGQFVGSDSRELSVVGQQNAGALGGGMMGRGGTAGLGGMFGAQGMNQFGRTGFGNQLNLNTMNGGANRQRIRVPLQLGFVSPATSPSPTPVPMPRFETRLKKIPQISVTGPLEVTMEGRTAVLRGQVGSDYDRDLAARLALLEPGIADVRNELEVAPQQQPETLPAPAVRGQR